MTTFSDLASVPSDPLVPFTDQLRLAVATYLARFKGSSASTPNPICAATSPGAPDTPWTRWPHSGPTWSCTSGGYKRSAGSSPPPSPGGSRLWPGSTAHAPSTASCSTHPPSTSAAPQSQPNRHARVHAPAIRGPAHRRPGVSEPVRFRSGSHARPAWLADLRSHQRGHRRPRRGTRPPGAAGVRQRRQGRAGPVVHCGGRGLTAWMLAAFAGNARAHAADRIQGKLVRALVARVTTRLCWRAATGHTVMATMSATSNVHRMAGIVTPFCRILAWFYLRRGRSGLLPPVAMLPTVAWPLCIAFRACPAISARCSRSSPDARLG